MKCLACGGSGTIERNGDYPLARCDRCDLVFASEWAAQFDEDFYDYYWSRLSWPEEAVYLPRNWASLDGLLARLERRVPSRHLLDVGCGEGHLVRAASKRGWQAEGIDLSEAAVAVAQRFGVNCSVTDFFSSTLDLERYGLISLIETIEHVPAPRRFFGRAAELLAPGGLLYLTTPNFNSLGRRILGHDWTVIGPGHIAYYTPRTLRRTTETQGLRLVQMRTKDLSVQALRRLGVRTPEPRVRDPETEVSEDFARQQALRERIDSSGLLRVAKMAANLALLVSGLGETIVAIWQRELA